MTFKLVTLWCWHIVMTMKPGNCQIYFRPGTSPCVSKTSYIYSGPHKIQLLLSSYRHWSVTRFVALCGTVTLTVCPVRVTKAPSEWQSHRVTVYAPFVSLLALEQVQQFSRDVILIDSHILITITIHLFEPIVGHWKQQTNLSVWHSGSCRCITIPSLVAKGQAAQNISVQTISHWNSEPLR